jgi:predicted TIM-barrel fold metal-dependent hydrolase
MDLESYRPQSALVTQQTEINRPRFPVIDAHNHLAEPFGGGWDKKPLSELLDRLDQVDIRLYIDLDGGWGEEILNAHLDIFKTPAPERFKIFGGVDWSKWPDLGNKFPEWAAQRLRIQKERGTEGLKVWKGFGLSVRDQRGELVRVDDSRLAPLWESAAELGLPVLIHVADPVAFFWPLDGQNERWEELVAHPDWQFPSPPFPSFQSIINGLANLVAAHPRTTFIGAHVGCYAENLGWVGELLERCPNFYVDIGARIAELGRQPYSARKFFLRYPDRILFGTDMGPDLDVYRLYFRFLETEDEYFNYDLQDPPAEGRWRIYGLALPEQVLEKVYFRNAERVIGKSGQGG